MVWKIQKFDIFGSLKSIYLEVRPCISNFKPNIRVGFQVGMSFLQFPKFDF